MRKALAFIAVLAALLTAGVAAKPTSGEGAFIVVAPNQTPTLGQPVTFHAENAYTKGRETSWVEVLCAQDVVVYVEIIQFPQVSGNVTLDPLGGAWSPWIERGGGDASCMATLFYWDRRNGNAHVNLAAANFIAAG